MGYQTSQAIEIKEALLDLGLRSRAKKRTHRFFSEDYSKMDVVKTTEIEADFHVKTEGNGRDGWGEAYAIIYTDKAHEIIRENAEALAERGINVTLFVKDGRPTRVSVSHGWTKTGVRTFDLDRGEFVQ